MDFKEKALLVLAGLLHDNGKFSQRAGAPKAGGWRKDVEEKGCEYLDLFEDIITQLAERRLIP